ncbi:MAG: HAMP domain-containing protein [Pseudomonadota bacterium]
MNIAKKSYRLRVRALLGLILFVLLAVIASVYQINVLQNAEENFERLGQLTLLEDQTAALAASSQNYLENAPRDFDSYARDLKVFLHDIRGDFDALEVELSNVESGFANNQKLALPAFFQSALNLSPDLEAVQTSLDASRAAWSDFRSGFEEKMGDDPEEPRLEWGAEFVVENRAGFEGQVMTMVKTYRAFLGTQSALSQRVVFGLAGTLAIFGLLGLLWFYLRVVRRIGQTTDACIRVANGDFGYSLRVSGNDEITLLSRAFNLVSSRSQLVVKLLSEIQQTQRVEDCLATVIGASGTYLPVAWTGLLLPQPDGSGYHVSNALPPQTLAQWPDRSCGAASRLGTQLGQALLSGDPVLVDDLPELAVAHPQDAFLRDFVRATQIKSLVALPMTSPKGWQGVLLFGSRSAVYREDQTALLRKLGPALAMHFERLIQ